MKREEFLSAFAKANPNLSRKDLRNEIRRALDSEPDDGTSRGHHHLIIAMEEMSELQKEISKVLRGMGDQLSLVEEMADVAICILYLQEICGISTDDLYKAMNVKKDRLQNILDHTGYHK